VSFWGRRGSSSLPQYFGPGAHPAPRVPPANNSHAKLRLCSFRTIRKCLPISRIFVSYKQNVFIAIYRHMKQKTGPLGLIKDRGESRRNSEPHYEILRTLLASIQRQSSELCKTGVFERDVKKSQRRHASVHLTSINAMDTRSPSPLRRCHGLLL